MFLLPYQVNHIGLESAKSHVMPSRGSGHMVSGLYLHKPGVWGLCPTLR